jgi:hypothetical protein
LLAFGVEQDHGGVARLDTAVAVSKVVMTWFGAQAFPDPIRVTSPRSRTHLRKGNETWNSEQFVARGNGHRVSIWHAGECRGHGERGDLREGWIEHHGLALLSKKAMHTSKAVFF